MRIERKKGYFIEFIENGIVDKLECRFDGICIVYYSDGNKKELKTICSVFNEQYGIPVSADGTLLFVGDWDKGLYAYDIDSGERIWKFRPGKITNIIVYSDFLIVARFGAAVCKIKIETGELLGKINSGTLEDIFDMGFPYIFADAISGKYSVVDVNGMNIVRKYRSEFINPNDCLGLSITAVRRENTNVIISGMEQYPHKKFDPNELFMKPFGSRVIDSNFNLE